MTAHWIPVEEGYYFATHRKYGWRKMVEIGKDGLGHTRVHAPRFSCSFGLEEFQNYVGPIQDPEPLPCQKKGK